MLKMQRLVLLLLVLLVCMSPLLADRVIYSDTAQTDTATTSQPAEAISQWTSVAGAAALLPRFFSKNPVRRETGRRMLDAVIITGALTELGKETIYSPRPSPFQSEKHGFPSGHTSFAFAIAASLSTREPRAAIIAYPAAAAVGWSRHQLDRHTWTQVIGGAMLGTYVGMRSGKGQWHLFGHTDAKLSETARLQAASSMLVDHKMVLWASSF